jgi:glycosyltransferase involved in cell wall biosynthesis
MTGDGSVTRSDGDATSDADTTADSVATSSGDATADTDSTPGTTSGTGSTSGDASSDLRATATTRVGESLDVLLVGPAGHRTGGIAHYVNHQHDLLDEGITSHIHDTATPAPEGPIPLSGLVGESRAVFWHKCYRTLRALARYPFHRRPDLVHVHASDDLSFLRAGLYVLLSALLWRVPVVLHVHGPTFDEFVADARPPLSWFQSLVFGQSDAVIVLSEYWAEVLAGSVVRENLVVLPNAVTPENFEPQYDADPPRIVVVSNLVPRKGITELFAAVNDLAGSGVPFEFVLAGDGPLRPDAEALAERHGEVTYHGYVSEAEKRRLLSEGTITVLASHAEGLPFALLEGMAGGNAVVATRVGSVPEVVGPENGRLVEPGDAEGLASGLRALLADPENTREMGRRNRTLVEERYAWDHVIDRLDSLYRRLVGGAAGSDR